MKYIGLQTQIWRNNTRSILLLILFPIILFALAWIFFVLFEGYNSLDNNSYSQEVPIDRANSSFIYALPWITIAVSIWFIIAYFSHTSMIKKATNSHYLSRKSDKRVYNLVENLCITSGMSMPKINVIEDTSLNAFASGINEKTFAITLSRGIIDKLNNDELEAVIAHELSHIRNKDVRLLIVSIVFVGIFAFISESVTRSMRFTRVSSGGGKKGGGIIIIILIIILSIIGYYVALLCRFALSRKREYMADAGSAEMTKNPKALASALRKINDDPLIEAVKRKDIAQMFIDNPLTRKKRKAISNLFATHPPIEERIKLLEQF